ncbi:hypothetical protein [Sediminicola luteus]|uniref:hypothetical protein n=1 Tax=Sediminicola luteus TaxID=319238 RepID=UPI0011449F94|nr:hypothetical protein [Sediminicola luteus]
MRKKKNPFKEIETKEDVPTEIRRNVTKDFSSLRLFFEFTELFLWISPSAIFDVMKNDEKEDREKGPN